MVKRTVFFLMVLCLVPGVAGAGLGDIVSKTLGSFLGGADKNATASLTRGEIDAGLKEALKVGAERAVAQAAREGGFSEDPAIRIPLPDNLAAIADKLRYLGLSDQVDSFENTMNTAAEEASEQALPILGRTIKNMSLEDVKKIWKGGDTAATAYLRQRTWQDIYEEFQPVITRHTERAGVTRIYKNLTANPAVSTLISQSGFDLDRYVTEETLDGLFLLLGREEEKIRNNPASRSTELLKKVFEKK